MKSNEIEYKGLILVSKALIILSFLCEEARNHCVSSDLTCIWQILKTVHFGRKV